MTKHMKICFKMLKTMHRMYAKYMKICFKMILDFNVSLKLSFLMSIHIWPKKPKGHGEMFKSCKQVHLLMQIIESWKIVISLFEKLILLFSWCLFRYLPLAQMVHQFGIKFPEKAWLDKKKSLKQFCLDLRKESSNSKESFNSAWNVMMGMLNDF